MILPWKTRANFNFSYYGFLFTLDVVEHYKTKHTSTLTANHTLEGAQSTCQSLILLTKMRPAGMFSGKFKHFSNFLEKYLFKKISKIFPDNMYHEIKVKTIKLSMASVWNDADRKICTTALKIEQRQYVPPSSLVTHSLTQYLKQREKVQSKLGQWCMKKENGPPQWHHQTCNECMSRKWLMKMEYQGLI